MEMLYPSYQRDLPRSYEPTAAADLDIRNGSLDVLQSMSALSVPVMLYIGLIFLFHTYIHIIYGMLHILFSHEYLPHTHAGRCRDVLTCCSILQQQRPTSQPLTKSPCLPRTLTQTPTLITYRTRQVVGLSMRTR